MKSFQAAISYIARILIVTLINLLILELLASFVIAKGFLNIPDLHREFKTQKSHYDILYGKQSGYKKVFVFGGSTAAGTHQTPHISVPILMSHLYQNQSSQDVAVFNFGRNGLASNRVLERFQQSIRHKPDTILVYSGHNEFLPDNIKSLQKSSLYEALNFLRIHSKLYNLILAFVYFHNNTKDPADTTEAPAPFTDPVIINSIAAQYRSNLEEIIHLGKQHGIEVLISTVVSNERAWTPAYAANSETLSESSLRSWKQQFDLGNQSLADNRLSEALRFYHQAEEIDSSHALLNYYLGKTYDSLGNHRSALEYYSKAVETDRLPFRAKSIVNQTVKDLCLTQGCLIDLERQLRRFTKSGIFGDDFFDDNAHLNARAQYVVASIFYDFLNEKNLEKDSENIDGVINTQLWAKIIRDIGLTLDDMEKILSRILDYIAIHPGSRRQLYEIMKNQALESGFTLSYIRSPEVLPANPKTEAPQFVPRIFDNYRFTTAALFSDLKDGRADWAPSHP